MVSKLLEPFIGGAFHELPRSTQSVPRGLRPDACVDKVYEIWEKTKEQRSTQMIFCDLSTPKEDVLLRLFDALRTDPNQLFCGSYRSGGFDLSGAERTLRLAKACGMYEGDLV